MKSGKTRGAVLAAAVMVSMLARGVSAQEPCSTARAVIDSARDDVLSVLTSDSKLVLELRREQNMANAPDASSVTPVRERFVCAKLAGSFDHLIAPGVSFAVLRIGPVYFARDPDQRRSTGIITDTAFHVLMRLGAAVPTGRQPNEARTR